MSTEEIGRTNPAPRNPISAVLVLHRCNVFLQERVRVGAPSLAVALLACILGCRSAPDADRDHHYSGEPGPDTTFYQEASFSPDATKLLVSRLDIHRQYRSSIAIVNVDGSEYTELAGGTGERWGSWSPDGRRIAFASNREGQQDIYVMYADGTHPMRLTTDEADDTNPEWSPDGSKIVFTSNRGGTSNIFLLSLEGMNLSRIGGGPEEKWNPRWSPDGTRIVYYGSTQGGKDSVYVMRTDGTGKEAVVEGIWPSWSTDGSRLLYSADDNIYSIARNGSDRQLIVADAFFARWSAKGDRLVFVRQMWVSPEGWPATSDVFVARADGTGEARITGPREAGR